MNLRWGLLAAVAFVAPGVARAAMTPAQALSYVRAGDLHLSPDGSKLAYVVGSYLWDAKPHVRILDLASGA